MRGRSARCSQVELKLASCLDAEGNPAVLDRVGEPYLSTDKDHLGSPCLGRGEVKDDGLVAMR